MRSKTDNSNSMDKLIALYLAGEATEHEVEELLEWIQASEDNKREFLFQKQTWNTLNPAFDKNKIDVDAAERILSKNISKESNRSVSILRRLASMWSRIAAVLLLPLILVAAYFLFHDKENSSHPVTVAANYGCSMETSLPDGSKVWLNANSRLTYNEPFQAHRRDVSLEGEGYFEVQSDHRNPFIVSTHDMTVTATGTAFNVNAYKHNNAPTSVTLVTGHVAVDIARKGSFKLNPGEHLTYKNGDVDITTNNPTDKYCSWTAGVLDFNDDTLQDIFDRLEQIYNVKFVVTDPSILSYRYHAKFKGETLSEILYLIEMTSPIKCIAYDKTDEHETQRIEVTLNN